MEARSTQALAWSSTLSSRTAGPDWTILYQVPSDWRAKPKPSAPTISGLGVRVEDDVGEDDGVVADGDVVADDGVGADVGVGSDAGGWGDGGGGVDAGGVVGRTVEELDGEGEGQVGIVDAEGGGGDFGEAGLDEDGCGFGGAGEGGVLGVGDEGEVAWFGDFNAGDAADFVGGVAVEGGVEVLG
jgi:hypothetical protein